MSVAYTWVQWNKHKKLYDLLLGAGVLAYIVTFMVVGSIIWTGANAISAEILMIRALGTCSMVMLHFILIIGPLAKLNKKFNPLLYNRRHFGVTMFVVGLAHGALALLYYHGFGNVNPLVSLLTNSGDFSSVSQISFQLLGAVALIILFFMAATSHDFWLKNLGPGCWKTLHMGVYVAYALLIAHVVLGAMQSEKSPVYVVLMIMGVALVSGLHIAAGAKANAVKHKAAPIDGTWIKAGDVNDIPEDKAIALNVTGRDPIAVFKYDNQVSAVHGVCVHQHGPLTEGKIVHGCVTCPWHGYQYRPGDGCSPPPYTEKIPTYEVRVEGTAVMVNIESVGEGVRVPPARLNGKSCKGASNE